MVESYDLAPNLKDFIGNGERFRDLSKFQMAYTKSYN